MIPDWQTNHVYFSGLLRVYHPRLWSSLEAILKGAGTTVATIPNTKDIWCRDYMPVQLDQDTFCQFTYNPDYLQGYDHLITPAAACRVEMMANHRRLPFVLDGGNVVAAKTKVILTDKVYQDNPGMNEQDIHRFLENAFQASCIVIPRPPNDPIAHADGVVRFIDEEAVLVNDYRTLDKAYGRKLRSTLDQHRLRYEEIPYFVENRSTDGIPSAAGCYVNYLRTESLIVLPVFGARQDEPALRKLESLFSGVKVIPLECNELARQGGCLNCISWSIAAFSAKR